MMKAIVTLVILEDLEKPLCFTKFPHKRSGIDLLDRVSSDIYSKHKSILLNIVEETTTLEEIGNQAMEELSKKNIKSRVSRIEIVEIGEEH